MRLKIFICLLLAGITLAIYWPVRHYGMVDYDDPLFVTENPEIANGLNWHSFVWAMTDITAGNWHPVTSLSFVLTRQCFGIKPGAEHLVNVIFHAANAVLLFLVLERMTRLDHDETPAAMPAGGPPRSLKAVTTLDGQRSLKAAATLGGQRSLKAAATWGGGAAWRSAAVAAIFAWHPLRVESVAWIAERKDVLCGFFFFLTLLAYARYAQGRSRVESRESKAKTAFQALGPRPWTPDYCLALVFFALALMSKPMAVTLPFVLLLLDFWPLRRFTIYDLRFTIAPLLREKIPFFALTVVFSGLTYWIQNNSAAVVSLANLGLEARICNVISSYVQYPAKLLWPAKLAVIYPFPQSRGPLEITLTALLLLAVTALCICQFFRRPWLAVGWFWYLGTSVPIIGLVQVGEQAMADRYTYLPLIGPVVSLVWLVTELFQSRKILPLAAATLVLAGSAAGTSRQLQFWRNTLALFEHAVAVTTDNPAAQYRLGLELEREGRLSEAMMHYLIDAEMNPLDYRVHYGLATCLEKEGRGQAALAEYKAVVSMAASPNDYGAHLNFADALSHLGRAREAAYQLNEALRVRSDSTEAMNNLAWLLATSPDADVRDGARAVQLAERACEITGYKRTLFVGTLAAAYAEAERFDDAIATAQKAMALAQQNGEPDLLQKNRELLELYRAHKPYHEAAGGL